MVVKVVESNGANVTSVGPPTRTSSAGVSGGEVGVLEVVVVNLEASCFSPGGLPQPELMITNNKSTIKTAFLNPIAY